MEAELSNKQVQEFIRNGYVRIDNAFSTKIAQDALTILWNDIPFDMSNPSDWKVPVIRLGMYAQKPFVDSINSKRLYSIFNQLVGEGKWIPCKSVGTFPVRFPTVEQPMDTGKHVDAGFPGDDPNNYLEWRVNIYSKGRALLMLVLYSEVSPNDAPTVIYKKSHLDVAGVLASEGEMGLSFMELAAKLDTLPVREKEYATGKAGTIYLCHPFLVHSAQPHTGTTPKLMAQPPLIAKGEFSLSNRSEDFSPVEQAIRLGISKQPN